MYDEIKFPQLPANLCGESGWTRATVGRGGGVAITQSHPQLWIVVNFYSIDTHRWWCIGSVWLRAFASPLYFVETYSAAQPASAHIILKGIFALPNCIQHNKRKYVYISYIRIYYYVFWHLCMVQCSKELYPHGNICTVDKDVNVIGRGRGTAWVANGDRKIGALGVGVVVNGARQPAECADMDAATMCAQNDGLEGIRCGIINSSIYGHPWITTIQIACKFVYNTLYFISYYYYV